MRADALPKVEQNFLVGRGEGRNPIDVAVGEKLYSRRILLGLSQQELADAIDVSFQQLQKYETGNNRISASRLYLLARVLRVPVSYFFETLPMVGGSGTQDSGSVVEFQDRLIDREIIDIVRSYSTIKNPAARKKVNALIKLLGEILSE